MPTSAPEVSVCIPTYCRYPLLVRAIASVLGQGFPSMEILVSDNASPDGSWANTEQLVHLDRRVSVYRNESNLGWAGNLNQCIARARGRYITFLCDDDELLPGMVGHSYEFLNKHPQVGIVHSAAEFVSLTGRRTVARSSAGHVLAAGIEALTQTALHFNIILSSAMVRASCFEDCGGFIDSISADYEMWSRISAKYGVGYVDRPLVRVYQHVISPRMTVELYRRESEELGERIAAYFPAEIARQPEFQQRMRDQLGQGMRSLGIEACIAGDCRRGFTFLSTAARTSSEYNLFRLGADVLRATLRRLRYLMNGGSGNATHI